MNLMHVTKSTILGSALGLFAFMGLISTSMAAPPEHCSRYSNFVKKQILQNKSKKCGFSGPLWNDDLDEQIRHCLETDLKKFNAEMIIRKKMLQKKCGR